VDAWLRDASTPLETTEFQVDARLSERLVMFPRASAGSRAKTMVLGAALLACPCGLFAQHGGGGGHIGGTAAGGSGLSGGNRATGIETKDDLRTFHEIMAVQATREQKAAYAVMVKSTAAAGAELQSLEEQLGREKNASAGAGRDKTFDDAIETARTLNKKFLGGFSEEQKSGLKEITKRLIKTDAELGQLAGGLDQEVEANAASSQMISWAQNLGRALASFQHAQVDLGEEMSITASDNSQESTFNIPAVKNAVSVAHQKIAITTSGVVSKGQVQDGENTFAVRLSTDMSDLQLMIADVMRAALNRTDRCGERIEVRTAALTPQAPAGTVHAQLHYERWRCGTMFGRESMDELVEGNGTIEVKLMPAVAEDGTLRFAAQIGRVDADGLLGESLRSGALGEMLRDEITESVLSVLRQGEDFKAALPAGTRRYATLQRAQFEGTGSGRLNMLLDGEIRVSNENLAALTSELKEQSSRSPERSSARPELMSR